MDAIECLLTRRSVRSYSDRPVDDSLIAKLLTVAMHAPSAMNEQPWHFIVIRDRKVIDDIESIHPYGKMLKSAPMAILVCGDTTIVKASDFWVMDCANATMNLLLAAHANGLGAVWVSVHPREDREGAISRLVGLPSTVKPLALIPLGYPEGEVKPKMIQGEDRIHYDRW